MNKFLLITTLLLTVFTFTMTTTAQLPPLIDREVFFDNPEYSSAQISPDGKYIAFRKPYKGTMNIWVKETGEPFEKARPLTNRTDRPIPNFFWSRDGKFILFVQDKGGDENFNVYAINPAEKPAAGADVPAARNLSEAQKVRAVIYDVPETDPNTIYVGLNERDKAWHDVYKVNIATGERTLVMENKDRLQGVIFDNADKMRLAVRSPQTGDTEILLLDGEKPRVIYSCGVFESCSPIRFHKDNKRVYISTNKGNVDLQQLVLLDITTGKEEVVESDPLKRVDLSGTSFSELTDEIIATVYTDDRNRIYFKDKKFENDYNHIKKKLGDREISFGSSTKDEMKFIVSTYSDTDPGTVWLYDRKTKNLSTLYQVREKLPREFLAPMKPVRYKSSDGMEIPAYLTLPKGVEAKNLPAVIVPHGGPWGRDVWGYNSMAQFLANRGYAVLQPNFRASTGFGKKFLNAGNNEWGQKMQDDITWGVKYLVEQGIADPKRVGIMGGSYGGYAALAGVTFTPDLYAASVAIVPPSNLVTLLEAIPPYWEAIRTVFYKRMGDPNTPEGLEQMKRQSPLTHAAKIKTPLMVVQGANDPRVNKRESDQIVIALRERNYPVEYIVAPDEGHGFARPVNNMAMVAAAEKFLAKHLGGRFQESMTPEVAQRLKEITVDPKTVTLNMPKKADMNAAPGANIAGKWDMTADAGGQQIPITAVFKQDGANITGTVSTPLGNGTIDSGKVSGDNVTGNLTVEVQGQMMQLQMEGKIEGNKMTGTLSGPGIPLVTFTATKAN